MLLETKPIKLSHSSMDTIEQCPHKWFLRYIEKLYPEVEDEDGSSTFGSFVHDVAEKFEGNTLKDLYELAKQKLPKYPINDNYKPKTKTALVNFFNYYKNNIEPLPKNQVKREKGFDIPYVDGFRLKGLVDLIIVRDKKLIVADYKTTKKPKDNTKQLSFYFFILKALGLIKQDTLDCEIIYLALEDNDGDMVVENYHLTEKDLDEVTDRIHRSINIITKKGKNKENWRKKTGPLCDYCEYKKCGACDAKNDDVDKSIHNFIINKRKSQKE
jgi:RecB family exonuclease